MRVSNSNISNFRSSHQVISIKKLFLKNYAIFTGKHLCWSLFFLFPEGLQLYQKEAPIQVFSCEQCDIFKNTYFKKHLQTTACKTLTKNARSQMFCEATSFQCYLLITLKTSENQRFYDVFRVIKKEHGEKMG